MSRRGSIAVVCSTVVPCAYPLGPRTDRGKLSVSTHRSSVSSAARATEARMPSGREPPSPTRRQNASEAGLRCASRRAVQRCRGKLFGENHRQRSGLIVKIESGDVGFRNTRRDNRSRRVGLQGASRLPGSHQTVSDGGSSRGFTCWRAIVVASQLTGRRTRLRAPGRRRQD